MIGNKKKKLHVIWRTRLAILVIASAFLAGCDSISDFLDLDPSEVKVPGARQSAFEGRGPLLPDMETRSDPILLPRPDPNPSWAQPGGLPNHAMHHIAVGPTLNPVWDADVGSGNSSDLFITAEPVVADGRVYAMDAKNRVSAFSTKDGTRAWRTDLRIDDEGDLYGGGLAYTNGVLYATTGYRQVVAMDGKSGKVLWRRSFETPFHSPPTVDDGRVFAITVDNHLYALDAEDGKTLWDHQGIKEPARIVGGASPAVDSGVVVVPYSSGELFALKVENGLELWNDSLAGAGRSVSANTLIDIRGRPIIDRGLVIAVSNGGRMAAINLFNGQRIWESDIAAFQHPWVAGNYIFVITNNNRLAAISRNNGKAIWVTELPNFEDPEDREGRLVWAGPLLISDRLIVTGSSGFAYSLSPYSGRYMGEVKLPRGVTTPPVVADKTVYFLSDSAELVAFR